MRMESAARGAAWRSTTVAACAVALLPAMARADETTLQLTMPLEIAENSSVHPQTVRPAPAVPPEPQRFAVSIGGLYTHRHGETAGWAPNVEVNYAATDRLQLHAMVPFAFDRISGFGTNYGIGDAEVGARYRFIDEDAGGWRPAVAIYPLVDFPTGDEQRNLGTGRTHVFLPLWFSKTIGDWVPYAGGGYWINPGPENKDWMFAAVGAIRVINAAWSLTGEVFHATAAKVGLKEQTGFDVGARYNMTAHHHLVFAVGRGIQNATDTNEITAYAAYVVTF